jgi:hypothetical protein
MNGEQADQSECGWCFGVTHQGRHPLQDNRPYAWLINHNYLLVWMMSFSTPCCIWLFQESSSFRMVSCVYQFASCSALVRGIPDVPD